MDLRRFITLKTVVEEGSFLRASQKLCCTQSTVTFHIQQLEQEFSVQLFEKIGPTDVPYPRRKKVAAAHL
ncbi:transcriptional regulator YfiE [Escherichia coli]|uniref:Transcriptional regulator YfiE n=1 Tax=Escherichia coli TaxID=562 RepID=A0A377C6P3_ECOLX|nr:transcriptional regulator YfiE [Escherichia coli]